jgi:hypothetical protein
MDFSTEQHRLELPASLRDKMLAFRRRVWAIKLTEAACGAAFGVLAAYLVTFALDRVWDTPASVRLGIFGVAVAACALVPLALHRWVWQHRRLEQLARLLRRAHPGIGDQLLGVIELVRSESEQARSLALCEAAVQQVAERAETRDFADAVPNPKHRRRAALAVMAGVAGLALLGLYPAAAGNAWARFLAPWRDTPRYTFAMVEGLPDRLVVAHGEPFAVTATLAEETVSRPAKAVAKLGPQPPVSATLADNRYAFDIPPQIDPGTLDVRVGDFTKGVRVEPMLRPELTALEADVELPAYLERPKSAPKDVRGGSVTLVNGSRVAFAATASRELASATVNGQPVVPEGRRLVGPLTPVKGDVQVEFRWQDQHGLGGKEPFVLTVTGREDQAPQVSCDGLPQRKVVLDTEQIVFKVTAQDDFGVKRVGFEWKGTDPVNFKSPAAGERMLSAGGPDKEALDLSATFSAKPLGIEPQPIQVRVFVEDYLPGRPRAYSPAYLLYVLNAEQHAIWLTEQLSKWHRQSLDVRDREMQLFATNKQLRALPAEELDKPETRRRIETQAEAERANGHRLTNLVATGEDLVRQAMRNPEFGVGHLEKWAEMLQILKDIAGNRMPTVADLLKEAAKAQNGTAKAPPSGPQAGQVRSAAGGNPPPPGKNAAPPKPPVPMVVDVESQQQLPKPSDKPQPPKDSKPASQGLPMTLLAGGGPPGNCPAGKKMDEAVARQQDLLAEFDKVADELNRVLANLEGSTLVKRLKAASRLQTRVAGRLGDQVNDAFGTPVVMGKARNRTLADLSSQEAQSSHDVSFIMDDLQAYFERRRMAKFKSVLDDMVKQDVVGGLRQLSDDIPKEVGLSMAQCEFWSDTLDRWAEDLVDPACAGCCPGSKSRDSLPPSIVLEVLQILEEEIGLREDTRVGEQARSAITKEQHARFADDLSKRQYVLRERTDKVTQRIRELPEGEAQFAKEIALLSAVSRVMGEATDILARPETGSPAIAAETEAIELLLQSKRFKPGGGGGGSNPGGGGGGTTNDSALTLVGSGVNAKEVRQATGATPATGETGAVLPEEFRTGLDAYFNRLEKGPKSR